MQHKSELLNDLLQFMADEYIKAVPGTTRENIIAMLDKKVELMKAEALRRRQQRRSGSPLAALMQILAGEMPEGFAAPFGEDTAEQVGEEAKIKVISLGQ